MDLMTLAAKITLDDSSYTKGIKNAETMGQQLAGKMSAMTVAVGNIAADVIRKSVSAISGVISGAIDGYANYQQLVGGVETLFKTSADKVKKYAEQSYKATGLSANAYMETVTSFSASLLQGLGGNTEAAADIANTAVQDMADNANKMGTDIGSIQAAYMGFAKQNYTMLDNLKLGYGGTASEMVRLINDSGILEDEITDLDGITFDQLVQAIHEVQTNLGMTGTTAKEAADTISGSKATLQAAWTDFLTSVGGEQDQNKLEEAAERFQETFKTYVVNNLLPAITTTLENTPELISAVSGAITSLPSKAIADLANSGVNVLTSAVEGAAGIAEWLIDGLVDMFKSASIDASNVERLGQAIGDFIGSAIAQIAGNLDTILAGIINIGISLAGGLIDGLLDGLFGGGFDVDKVNKELSQTLFDVNLQSTKADAILDYMDDLIEKYGTAAKDTGEWKSAQSALEKVLGGSGEVFEQYGNDIGGAVEKLHAMNDELKQAAVMNALQKASSGQMELLATQTLAFNEQGYIAEQNRRIMQSALENSLNYIMEHASTAAETYKQNSEEFGNFDPFVYKQLSGFAEGKAYDAFGNFIGLLEDMDFSELKRVISDITDDSQMAKAEIEANEQMYQEAENAATQAEAKMAEIQKEIDATNDAIEATKNAMAKTVEDLLNEGSKAGQSIEAGGNAARTALENFAQSIGGIQINLPHGIGFMPRAVGIDYVPTDNFRTELHRGEAVLTASENAQRRSGANADEFAEAMESALITAMNRVKVYMSGEKVGDLTTKRVRNNINSTNHARTRSMGG